MLIIYIEMIMDYIHRILDNESQLHFYVKETF